MPDVRRVDQELGRLATDKHDFAEILRSPSGSLSLSVVRWPAGSIDDQQPHTDEVYFVTSRSAVLIIGDDRAPAQPGCIAFVAAGVEHRFVDIREDLETLVFWSPARHVGGR